MKLLYKLGKIGCLFYSRNVFYGHLSLLYLGSGIGTSGLLTLHTLMSQHEEFLENSMCGSQLLEHGALLWVQVLWPTSKGVICCCERVIYCLEPLSKCWKRSCFPIAFSVYDFASLCALIIIFQPFWLSTSGSYARCPSTRNGLPPDLCVVDNFFSFMS